MRRYLSLFAALTFLAAALTGCGAPAQEQEASGEPEESVVQQAEAEEDTPEETPAPQEKKGKKARKKKKPRPVYVKGTDPITGESVDEDDESRPIAVMIQNSKRGYPQWGIKGAEVIVEGISEGDQTAMMAMYSGHEGLPDKVGGVGPGRDLFWQMALPVNGVMMQIGSNAYADNLLNYFEHQNLDGRYVGVAAYDLDYEKDRTVNHEYCWYTSQELMENGLEHYGLSDEGDRQSLFNFAPEDDESELGGEPAERIEITFAEGNTIPLLYNGDAELWEKYDIDWEPQVDGTFGEEESLDDKMLRFDNVIVLYCSAGIKDDGYTRDYDLTKGTGLYLHGPACRKIRWEKPAEDRGFTIYAEDGKTPLPVQVGKTYIAVYGGFEGQHIKVKGDGEELALWDDPAPMAAPEDGE